MGKDNLIYVSMINYGNLTAFQKGQVHTGHKESITYTHDELIQKRENCKHHSRYKILGYDTCKNVRRLRLNRRIARGSGLKYIKHRRQQILNSRFMDITNLIYPTFRTHTTIINEDKKVSISIMNSQSLKSKEDQIQHHLMNR